MTQQALREQVIRAIPQGSIGRYDLLPLFLNAELFTEIVTYLASPYKGKIDCVAAPEAIGWILGSAIAASCGVGFIAIRKGERLPYADQQIIEARYTDYSHAEKSLAIKAGSLHAVSRILLADEWIETGASIRSCIDLLTRQGCNIAGIATIGINENEHTRHWIDTGFALFIGKDI